jgi:3-hydroxypropanoate dehydrogenase
MAETFEFNIDISPKAQAQLFTEARTTYNWLPTPVEEHLIESSWDLAKMAPTQMNCLPLRIKVLKSDAEKSAVAAAAFGTNQGQIESAPMTIVCAADLKFYEHMPTLFPFAPGMNDTLAADPIQAAQWANNNAWLQAGYLILALRAHGLGVGPKTGADFEKIKDALFAGKDVQPFMIINVGFAADPATDYPRNPRLSYAEVSL